MTESGERGLTAPFFLAQIFFENLKKIFFSMSDDFLQTEIECQFESAVGHRYFSVNNNDLSYPCILNTEVFGNGSELSQCWVFSTAKSWASEVNLERDTEITIDGVVWVISEDISENTFVYKTVVEKK